MLIFQHTFIKTLNYDDDTSQPDPQVFRIRSGFIFVAGLDRSDETLSALCSRKGCELIRKEITSDREQDKQRYFCLRRRKLQNILGEKSWISFSLAVGNAVLVKCRTNTNTIPSTF